MACCSRALRCSLLFGRRTYPPPPPCFTLLSFPRPLSYSVQKDQGYFWPNTHTHHQIKNCCLVLPSPDTKWWDNPEPISWTMAQNYASRRPVWVLTFISRKRWWLSKIACPVFLLHIQTTIQVLELWVWSLEKRETPDGCRPKGEAMCDKTHVKLDKL